MRQEEQQPSSALSPAVAAELRDLVQQAKAGDVSVLPRLRALLDGRPEIWKCIGDLERIVVRSWVELLAGDDPLSREAIRRKVEEFRAELEGNAPTPVERLLIGQIVSTWLEMNHAQLAAVEPGRTTLGQASLTLKRAESVQRRYLQAIRTLTAVRALLPRGLLPAHHLRLQGPDQRLA
jgi:hypothetical protein